MRVDGMQIDGMRIDRLVSDDIIRSRRTPPLQKGADGRAAVGGGICAGSSKLMKTRRGR
jgi:hypothetical protein